MDFVTELNSAMVVERTGLQKLNTEKMNEALSAIYTSGKPVIMVDSATVFFSTQNLLQSMDDPQKMDHLTAIFEKRGIQMTVAEMNTLSGYHALKNRVLDSIRSQTPEYAFAEIPEGWDVDSNLTFLTHMVRRSNNDRFSIGYKTLERIWNVAGPYWAGYSTEDIIADIRASGYHYNGQVYDNRVKIGCQDIQRYELEQVAVKKGWQFPKESV